MSVRFEWMHLPHVEYVPQGYDVREGEVVPEDETSDETTVSEGGALLLSADECTVITGDPEDLADWAVRALDSVVEEEGANLPLYEKCAICHLFVEPNTAYEANWPSNTAPFVHLCNDDYPEDEALDASHEAHPSGVQLPLAVWKQYGPAHMRAMFGRR